MWVQLILISAVFLSLYDLAKKASVNKNEILSVLLCSNVFAFIFFVAWTIIRNHVTGGGVSVSIPLKHHPLLIFKSCLVGASWVFTYYALRSLPITIATPIRACAPFCTLVAAMFIYSEIPSTVQFIGIVLVFVGYATFSYAGKCEQINFLHNRYVGLAVAGMICSSVGALFDKFLLQKMMLDKFAMQFCFQFYLLLLYLALFAIQRGCGIRHTHFQWRWTIPLIGTLLATADYFYFAALAVPDAPVSLVSVMRRISVVFTFILGARVFHENNLLRKGIALALILTGIVLLSFK